MTITQTTTAIMYPMPSHADILAFQFSSWYPLFSSHTIKSTIIRPLPAEFTDYLKADGIFVPEGSENASVKYIIPFPNYNRRMNPDHPSLNSPMTKTKMTTTMPSLGNDTPFQSSTRPFETFWRSTTAPSSPSSISLPPKMPRGFCQRHHLSNARPQQISTSF